MRLEIPFDAAQVLQSTTLKTDHPDVWARYLNQMVTRFGHRLGARVYTSVGLSDLRLIRSYFVLWLGHQDLLPEEEQEDRSLLMDARLAVHRLDTIIETAQDQEAVTCGNT